MISKFLDAMDDDKEYDFIANNYYQMSKEDLKSILLEYIYAVHTRGLDFEKSVQEDVREELEEKEIFG
jgi:hypothetical protein